MHFSCIPILLPHRARCFRTEGTFELNVKRTPSRIEGYERSMRSSEGAPEFLHALVVRQQLTQHIRGDEVGEGSVHGLLSCQVLVCAHSSRGLLRSSDWALGSYMVDTSSANVVGRWSESRE
jgi:hypothetical protein